MSATAIRALHSKQAEIDFDNAFANLRRLRAEAPEFLQALIENFDFFTSSSASSHVWMLSGGASTTTVPVVVEAWPHDIVGAMVLVTQFIDQWRNPNAPMIKILRVRQNRAPCQEWLALPPEERAGWLRAQHNAPWIRTPLGDGHGVCFMFRQWFTDETAGSLLHEADLLTPERLRAAGNASREVPSPLQMDLMKILAEL